MDLENIIKNMQKFTSLDQEIDLINASIPTMMTGSADDADAQVSIKLQEQNELRPLLITAHQDLRERRCQLFTASQSASAEATDLQKTVTRLYHAENLEAMKEAEKLQAKAEAEFARLWAEWEEIATLTTSLFHLLYEEEPEKKIDDIPFESSGALSFDENFQELLDQHAESLFWQAMEMTNLSGEFFDEWRTAIITEKSVESVKTALTSWTFTDADFVEL
ncbi:MAG: hypothetical protein GY797_10595, partial [Deltaproteobacteria bacterium]|nr:hypothetical protein [Deltaproteobacteria bacterium]